MKNKFLFLILCFSLIGCSHVMEIPKTIWGSSTRALENYRHTATVKGYPLTLEECFDSILLIAAESELDIFIQDRKRNIIVLMGFEGVTDTTEVGIFLTAISINETKFEIVSLSSIAQATAADLIFLQLNEEILE